MLKNPVNITLFLLSVIRWRFATVSTLDPANSLIKCTKKASGDSGDSFLRACYIVAFPLLHCLRVSTPFHSMFSLVEKTEVEQLIVSTVSTLEVETNSAKQVMVFRSPLIDNCK
jgi:hypothetical protein